MTQLILWVHWQIKFTNLGDAAGHRFVFLKLSKKRGSEIASKELMVVSRQGHVASCPEPSGVTRQKKIPWTYWKDPTRFHDVASFQSAVHFKFYSWTRYFSYWFNLLAVWFTNNEVREETENSKIWTLDLQLEVTQCRMAQNLPVPLGTRLVAAAAGWLRLGGPVFWPSATGLLGTVSTMSRVADLPFWTFMNPANSSIVYICRIHTQPVDFPNPLTSGMNINHGTETVSNFLLRLLSVRRASSSRCFHWWGLILVWRLDPLQSLPLTCFSFGNVFQIVWGVFWCFPD